MFESVEPFDEALLHAARSLPTPIVWVFFALTMVGGGWGLFVVVPFLFRARTRTAALWLLAAQVTTSGAVSLGKSIFQRVRPCDALDWCAPMIGSSPGGYSFPSGHAAGSFAFAAFVSLVAPRFWPLYIALAALIAASRCVLGVHYPSDVLVGAVLGSSIGTAFALAHLRAKRAAQPASQSAPKQSPDSP